MNQTKRTVNSAILMLFLFFTGGILDILPFAEVFMFRDLASVYYLTVSIVAILFFGLPKNRQEAFSLPAYFICY